MFAARRNATLRGHERSFPSVPVIAPLSAVMHWYGWMNGPQREGRRWGGTSSQPTRGSRTRTLAHTHTSRTRPPPPPAAATPPAHHRPSAETTILLHAVRFAANGCHGVTVGLGQYVPATPRRVRARPETRSSTNFSSKAGDLPAFSRCPVVPVLLAQSLGGMGM